MNKRMIVEMMLNKKIVNSFLTLHSKFKSDKNYHVSNMVKCGWNVIKDSKINKHDGNYVISSFIPPINTDSFIKMALQVPDDDKSFFENHVLGKRLAPISTYVAITSKCGYNCWHCSASNQINDYELNLNQAYRIIDQLNQLKVSIIGFTGGEPLLRDDLELIIKRVEPSTTTYLFTSGYQLSFARALSLKESGLFGIGISLDTFDKDQYNKMRQHPKAFEHAITAIKNAKKANLYTMVQTVCTKEMIQGDKLEMFVEQLAEFNVDEVRILEPLPLGSLEDNEKALLSKEEQMKLKNYHIKLNHNKKYPKVSVFPYFESSEQFGCGAGVQHSYVDSKGNFMACDFLSDSFGNLLDDDIGELWSKMHAQYQQPCLVCRSKFKETSLSTMPLFYRLMGGYRD